MSKKIISTLILTHVLVLSVGVYGGMQYGANNVKNAQLARSGGNFGGGAGGQRGQGQGMRGAGNNGGAGDFAGGQIVSKDDTSVTIKTRNGGSQIVFFSPSTSIDKSVSGATSDLTVGQQIMANGKTNPDGSIAAQNIQIRSASQNPSQNPGQN